MKLNEPIKRDFSYTECMIMIKILEIEEQKDLTQALISRLIEMPSTSPTFTKVFKYLVEKNIIIKHAHIGQCQRLELNYDLLLDLIDEQEVVENFFEFFNVNHFAEW
jgi:hypothetical protein